MNYQSIYDQIINRALLENREKLYITHKDYVYYEAHHKLPKCLYPEYADFKEHPWNKVLLTAEEHYVCHQLLVKIYPENRSLVFAASNITATGIGQTGRSTLKEFAWLRKRRSEILTGRKLTKESIEKRTETRRLNGWNRNPEETKRKQSSVRRGREFSEDHRKNLSISHTGIKYGPCSEERKLKLSRSQQPKRILCVELNIIFESIREASIIMGNIKSENIRSAANNGNRGGPYHWKYV